MIRDVPKINVLFCQRQRQDSSSSDDFWREKNSPDGLAAAAVSREHFDFTMALRLDKTSRFSIWVEPSIELSPSVEPSPVAPVDDDSAIDPNANALEMLGGTFAMMMFGGGESSEMAAAASTQLDAATLLQRIASGGVEATRGVYLELI